MMRKVSLKTRSPRRLRWSLAMLFCLIGFIAYMDRANIAIVAEAMMHDTGMSKTQFGLLGSIFSLSYGLAQIPAGMLVERFGSRLMVSLSLLFWSLFTILTALTPRFFWLCIIRFLFGLGEAPTLPGNAIFNSWWFRQNEKARAASILLFGAYMGPTIAPLLTLSIMLAWGWQWVFYIYGIIGIFIALLWFICARDRPEIHPWISRTELEYIQSNRALQQNNRVITAHWKRLISNSEFWALGVQYFGIGYIVTLFMIWLPTYLQEAHGFSLVHMGVAASLPWLALCCFTLFSGTFSDALIQRGICYKKARSHVAIAGLVMAIISLFGTTWSSSAIAVVCWLTLALGSLGLPLVISWATAIDKGRQYTGSVSGWMNLWGNLGSTISPTLCGWLVQYSGWNMILLLNCIPLSLAIICWLFVKPDRPLE